MVKTAAENKKGILSYIGEALMKVFNAKQNKNCPVNVNKKE